MENFDKYTPAVQIVIVISIAAVAGIFLWQLFKSFRES